MEQRLSRFHQPSHDQGVEQRMVGAVARAAHDLFDLADCVPAQVAGEGQEQEREVGACQDEK